MVVLTHGMDAVASAHSRSILAWCCKQWSEMFGPQARRCWQQGEIAINVRTWCPTEEIFFHKNTLPYLQADLHSHSASALTINYTHSEKRDLRCNGHHASVMIIVTTIKAENKNLYLPAARWIESNTKNFTCDSFPFIAAMVSSRNSNHTTSKIKAIKHLTLVHRRRTWYVYLNFQLLCPLIQIITVKVFEILGKNIEGHSYQ